MNKINNYYSTSTIFVLRKWCVVWSIFFFCVAREEILIWGIIQMWHSFCKL